MFSKFLVMAVVAGAMAQDQLDKKEPDMTDMIKGTKGDFKKTGAGK